MKYLFIPVCIWAALSASAQEVTSPEKVLDLLRTYHVTLTDMTLHVQPMPADYAFDMQVETPDPQYPVTYTASYDPTRNPAWVMRTWNGKPAEKYQQNVLADRVKRYATAAVKVDETTLKSATEGQYTVITFRLVPETVPKAYMYLKDCNARAYIHAGTGRLERTVWENFQPTKDGAVRVTKMHEEVTYSVADGAYHVQREVQRLNGSVDTKSGNVGGAADQTITYSNYRKVK